MNFHELAVAGAYVLEPERQSDERGYFARTFCVDELATRASGWTIERAAREARIDPAALDAFVELYAATAPAVIRCGWGIERNRNGGSAVAAVHFASLFDIV